MNPFIERKHELIDLHKKKDRISADIKKIQKDLEDKINALTEVHKNLLNDTEKKIKEFPRICDHTLENGAKATDKEHKIMIPGITNNMVLVKQMCTLCGGTISEEKVVVDKKPNAEVDGEFKTWYQTDDLGENFVETLTFDPNFTSNFLGYIKTSGLFSGIIKDGYINTTLNTNNDE